MYRTNVSKRLDYVYDTAAGSQADSKGMGKYVKALQQSVGITDHNELGAKDFLKAHKKGI